VTNQKFKDFVWKGPFKPTGNDRDLNKGYELSFSRDAQMGYINMDPNMVEKKIIDHLYHLIGHVTHIHVQSYLR